MSKHKDNLNKSKETNTFRFKTFGDRVNEIDIRRAALYYIGHENEELPEGTDQTYFNQTVQKWNVLNLTEEYNEFSKQCNKIVTLPQLLHKKDFVIDLLLEKLSTATNLSLQPLLEILVVLGRDLREEFYNYFQRVLDRLICLLNTNDPDQLEWTLVCLAFLFKTLKPFLKRNIGIIFNAILPLLDESRYSEHVTNFSVECFAFIARDIKDYGKLRNIVLDTIEKEKVESVHGCGRLFFEIVRGVNGRFHAVAEIFLKFLFNSFLECESKYEALFFQIVESTVDNILRFIQPHNMPLFWNSISDAILLAIEKPSLRAISFLISFVSQAIRWKDGKFLSELETMVTTILKIIDRVDNSEVLLQLSDVICLILLSSNAKVTQLDTSRLIKKIMSIQHRNVYESFVWNICQHSQFELLVLPEYLKYVEKNVDNQNLILLTSIVLKKSPIVCDGNSLANWKSYPVIFKKPETFYKIETMFVDFKIANSKQMEEFLLISILTPHLISLDSDKIITKLLNICSELCKCLKAENDNLDKYLFILLISIGSVINLKIKLKQCIITDILEATISKENILALRIINIILNKEKPHYLKNDDNFKKFKSTLSSMVYSHNLVIRQLASNSLQLIYNTKSCNPYEIFYKVESIEPTVHTYREQVMLLQKLQPSSEFFKTINDDDMKTDCLRHLLGLLYHNFKLLWDPVLKMIEEYSSSLSIEQFWKVYKVKLEETVLYINGVKNEGQEILTNWLETDVLKSLYVVNIQNLKKVDFRNYRIQLWKEICHYNSIREVKNREIVGLFLDFVNEEYKKNVETKVFTWNLSENSEITDGSFESDDEDEHSHNNRNHRSNKRNDFGSAKITLTTLITKMAFFVNQPNPKALYRESELYAFYLQLLSGTNPLLRKIALDCIMSYKHKSLLPYKEHLYGLMDEKKFKDELVNFKIDKDSDHIHSDHRKHLMEILLRILYGKMITKSTAMGSQVRKGTVLRYLSGCEKEEIFWFLRMAFSNYECYLDEDLELIPTKVKEMFNLTAVWSPKKLQSTINILELIQNQFGGLMDGDFLLYMLKIIIFVGSACKEVILTSERVQIMPKILSIYRNVKNLAVLSLVKFFNHFESFEWTKIQGATITDIFVWDNLEKLPQDSIHSPTPLLRLLLEWGKTPKLYWLLVQEKNGVVPFKYIIDLLLNDHAKFVVRKHILELIERLLTTQSETIEEVTGIMIIQPYILEILKRLKMNFNIKSSRRGLDKRDLNILSLLTNYVEDSVTCDSLLQLLLPILVSKSQNNASEEVVCQVITTLSNLIKRLENPQLYIQKIAPLFEQVQEVNARKMLCELIHDIARLVDKTKQQNAVSFKETAKIISELNAWDKRWVEQPDYDKRLGALKSVSSKVNDGTIDMDLGILVIYNCFYFIKYDKDMGLRDNASEHLKLLVPKLIKKYENSQKDVDYLVGDVLLALVRRTFRDNNDNVRNEGINLLGEMARKCSSSHQILKDLSPLADNEDVEVDFFQNITHLQSHRHGRALLKFCSLARTLNEVPSYKTLTQFILPLASRYLCNEKHAAKHNLIDAAIETVGVVCQLLPWSHYLTVFKFFLQKMRSSNEHQKQCVRIVVAILDGFHFDLSAADLKTVKEEQMGIENSKKKFLKQNNVNMVIGEKEEEIKIIEENENNDEDNEQNDEDLDSKLNELSEDDENLDIKGDPKTKRESIFKQQTVLPINSAKKVIQAISTVLIPTLNHSITEKSSYDNKHKLNRKKFSFEREEEEILRVPIALAMVKLLQKLPKQLLDNSLPGVFMKVCTFLKSPLKSVRMLTRDILKKIMLTLGASYLSMLFDHMTTLLTRGFQVHVLAVTVHGVLDVLKEQLQPGDIESCLKNILEVSLNDIFGEISAEKEIEKIAAHTPEAKPSAKSYLVLHIVARNIQESCLMDILLPFKEYLAKSQSRKLVLKIQECFQRIVTGLVENKNIARESLLIFIYGTMSESITDLIPGSEKRILTEKEKEKMRLSRPDCYIIPEAPRSRGGIIRKGVKKNSQANAHILVEFGLEMLHFVIKRKKLNEIGYEPFLTPLLPLLRDALQSTHIRTTTFALKCITAIWNGEYVLPAIKEFLDDIVNKIFEILHSNATFGTTKQDDNFHLVKSAFKSVVALLRKCGYYEVNNEHISQLLLYIEQDLQEGEKQPMAFNLIKAIISRQIVMPEVHEIMQKVCELSIVSESDFAKEEARTIAFTYTMEYKLKQKVDSIVKFYTNQLNFSLPSGRLSAVKFLVLIAKKFPSNTLAKHAEFLYLSLGQAIANEEFPELREAIAECLELLISKLDKEKRDRLFNMTLLFFDSDKPSVREMAALLCSRFAEQEKQSFEHRTKLALPILVGRLSLSNPNTPGRFVRPLIIQNDDEDVHLNNLSLDENDLEMIKNEKQRFIDHELIQIQNCINKILELCPNVFKNEELFITLDELAYQSQRLLGYEHEWVRINGVKTISIILTTFDFQLIGSILCKEVKIKESNLDFIYQNAEQDIKSLVLDLCAQLIPGETNEEILNEVIKIMLFVANMLKNVSFEPNNSNEKCNRPKINLYWLIKRLKFAVNNEIAKAPHSCVLRTAVFNWIEGLIALIDNVSIVENLTPVLLSILVRETSDEDQNIDPQLRQQAIRVTNKLRKRIGSDLYDKHRTNVQRNLMLRRTNRKRQIAQQKINDPETAAKRRKGVQERKKASKKRKTDVYRGKIEGKKKRRKINDDDMF